MFIGLYQRINVMTMQVLKINTPLGIMKITFWEKGGSLSL